MNRGHEPTVVQLHKQLRRVSARSRFRHFARLLPIALVFLVVTHRPALSLPELLRNLRAEGGLLDGCPLPEWAKTLNGQLKTADSPEFERRLLREFPPGTSSKYLTIKLEHTGFTRMPDCRTDKSVRLERFVEAVAPLVAIQATVYWKTDASRNVVWTRGFIKYLAP